MGERSNRVNEIFPPKEGGCLSINGDGPPMTNSRSGLVRAADAAEIVQLAHDLQDMPLDIAVRDAHLLRSLCAIFSCRVTFLAIVRVQENGLLSFLHHAMGGDLDPDGARYLHAYAHESHVQDPLARVLAQCPSDARIYRRVEIINDSNWYRLNHYNEVAKIMGIDDRMYACFPFDRDNGIVGVGLHRSVDSARFGRREVNTARLLAAPLIGLARLATQPLPSPPAEALTPRLRDVLWRFQLGDSEKQAAAALGIRLSTLHGYAKELYRRMGVSSRSELLAACLRAAAGMNDAAGRSTQR